MDMIQLIVECTMDEEREQLISNLATVKYRLPMIDSYVIELPQSDVKHLSGMKGIKAVHQTAKITAQMNMARKAVNADKVQSAGISGRGVSIAILDTGVSPVDDLVRPRNRIIAFKDMINGRAEPYDDNGHGTHVAGIAAGNGYRSNGKYAGIAPACNIVAIKILDESGSGNSADVLAGIQWLIDNRKRYNIRIANLSVGTPDNSGRDPLVRAVNAAWDCGIVMTIAAGNNGPEPGTITSPGISRKVITVGASDDNNPVQIWDNTLENFSGRGPTSECIMKPDVIAPGAAIVSCLTGCDLPKKTPESTVRIVSNYYLEMSGTSMSTPIVSGAIALLLEKNPDLKPNDVKHWLKNSTQSLHYPQNQQGWGLINIEKLVMREVKNHVKSTNL